MTRVRVLFPVLALATLIAALLPGQPASAATAGGSNLVVAAVGASVTTDIISVVGTELAVSANLSEANAPLQARAATVGSWEEFTFTYLGNGDWTIRSTANNRFVSANLSVAGTDAPLQARATAVGSWETFYIIDNGDATKTIVSAANHLAVTANYSLTNAPLKARALVTGSWEKFFIPGVG